MGNHRTNELVRLGTIIQLSNKFSSLGDLLDNKHQMGIFGCGRCLNILVKRYSFYFIWILGHGKGIGICRTGELSVLGATIRFSFNFLAPVIPRGPVNSIMLLEKSHCLMGSGGHKQIGV